MDNKRIYIIEDDADLLYDLESQFSADNFETEVSYGDEELFELIQAIEDFAPDYIVLDLILPKIDGFDLLKTIKESPDLVNKPIFVFTDLSEEDNKARSLSLGADYVFFRNTFDAFEFAEKVKKIVKNKEKDMSYKNEDDEDDGDSLLAFSSNL